MKRFMAVRVAAVCCMALVQQASAADIAIQNGSKVAFDYTLTVDGKVLDSSAGKAPLEYTQGDGKMIPGLSKQLEGLKAGDERDIIVKPEDAYGIASPAAIKEIPLSKMPSGLKLEPGMILDGQSKDGRSFPSRVIEVKSDAVVMDMNHPLAGKTLNFKVKIVSVR